MPDARRPAQPGLDGHGTVAEPAAEDLASSTTSETEESSVATSPAEDAAPTDGAKPAPHDVTAGDPPWQAPASGWQAALEPAGVQAGPAEEADDQETVWGTPTGLTAGIAAAGIAAAGMAALVRHRRRAAIQRRPPGLRLPTPAPDTTAAVARLETAAASDEPLEDLTAPLGSIPPGVTPPLVGLFDDGDVRLLFDDMPPPPGPVGRRRQPARR